MTLTFTSPHGQKPGVLATILKKSYAELLESDPTHWSPEIPKWDQFDREVFEYPDSAGACVFLSWSDDQLIGFGSYDPRRKPEFGIVSHNCILPDFRRRGFGQQQVEEILRRLQGEGVITAKTSTLDGSPAQHMHLACGFHEKGRTPWDGDPSKTVVEYEREIGQQ